MNNEDTITTNYNQTNNDVSSTYGINSRRALNEKEKYLKLIKAATRLEDVVDIIEKITESSLIYTFGEFLDLENVKSLVGTNYEPYYNLLTIFAYDTYKDYCKQKMEQPEALPTLNENMLKKLRLLTIVTLCRTTQNVLYNVLIEELKLDTIIELEDIIIDAIYLDLIKGIMDHMQQRLEVESTMGRDVRFEDLGNVLNVLNRFVFNCDTILDNLDYQMTTSNRQRTNQLIKEKEIEYKKQAKLAEIYNEESKKMLLQGCLPIQSPIGNRRNGQAANNTNTEKRSNNQMAKGRIIGIRDRFEYLIFK